MGKKVGAEYLGDDTCQFCVWAPEVKSVELTLKERSQPIPLAKDPEGYWKVKVSGIKPGSLYKYRLENDSEFPDPASLAQPEGVHSWSQVVDHNDFKWTDAHWKGRQINEMLIYELHVGTFTREGTFEAIIEKLDHLEELGVNTLEIMPIAQFPGGRNWGYDGVYPFAAQDSYGGVGGLKKLIDACHIRGFSVLLDVVYNHLGPEGNYLSAYGPYFTDKYHTPWGSAINFDDRYSDQVRNHFLQNAMMWLKDFHFDGLRLDATHEIIDRGAVHFLKELAINKKMLEEKTGRHYVLIAESDLNDAKIVSSFEKGGYGLDAQWVDDFHHGVHTILTGEKEGYYSDFGSMEFLAKSFKQAFIYDGIYSNFRKRSVGNEPLDLQPWNFVVCVQNHDQVGNRPLGERFGELLNFEQQKLAAATLLTSPFVPMLFMGEEFGEKNRFQYFISHGDEDLVRAVQEGRKREFEYFFQTHQGAFPDPQAGLTFQNSQLNWEFNKNNDQVFIFNFYKELLKLRKNGVFHSFQTASLQTIGSEDSRILKVSAQEAEHKLTGIFNFGAKQHAEHLPLDQTPEILVSSADPRWGGEYPQAKLLKKQEIIIPPAAVLIWST